MPPFEWDGSEEKARERRIAERRERVQERLRLQQQRAKASGGAAALALNEPALPSTKAKQQAAQSADSVRRVLAEAQAVPEAAALAAEQRVERHREACDVEEGSLQEQVAREAEGSRRENHVIDLEWEELLGITQPQALYAGIQAVSAHCQRVLDSKDAALHSIRALLRVRDEQYIKLLQAQSEETDALIASMHQQHERLKCVDERELEAVEGAYMQERAELLAVQKGELEVLLARRSAVEQEFMEQYLAACEEYEEELERLRLEGLAEHGALKRQLEAEVAGLELHLDGIRAAHALNADKLDYNYRVLVERERESKDALLQQKRRITRQWAVLNRLRKRYAAVDRRCAADNARLSDEYQQVARAFNHLQSKFRRFKAADLARFEQIRGMKEEELSELLEQLLEAEHLICSYVVGLPAGSDDIARATAGASVGDGNGQQEGASSGLGLELVGTAVAVHPLTEAAAAAASGPANGAADVVTVPASEVPTARGQLIPAYYPAAAGGGEGVADGQMEPSSTGTEGVLDLAAAAELRASADSGALSLLLAESGLHLTSQKLRTLLQQVPAVGPDGLLSADAVARSLGLQHQSTVAVLESLFAGGAGSDSPPTALGETIRPQESAAAEGDGPAGSGPASQPPAQVFSVEQVELGLGRLVQLLLGGASRAAGAAQPGQQLQGAAAARSPSPAPAVAIAAPTSKRYWQARADAALPPAVVRSWGLLQQQASTQFATLRSGTATADEVLKLRQENEKLKASLADLLTSPLNAKLQLPPTLLLG